MIIKTIRISEELKEILDKYKRHDETYDHVLCRLLSVDK